MGNQPSSEQRVEQPAKPGKGFPGSAFVESMLCGIDTTQGSFIEKADQLCISSPVKNEDGDEQLPKEMNPTAALFARALVSEVTDNPNTMTPQELADREKKLLKAQEAAKKQKDKQAVGAPGGIGKPSLLGSIANAFQVDEDIPQGAASATLKRNTVVEPPSELQENRAQIFASDTVPRSKHRITIGLSLSRRHSTVGHPDTVTRQTAFDFNELQDREYKYVSSTDSSGWRAGGGEGPSDGNDVKVAAPDTVHIPIIHIDADSPEAVDVIISALARGEVFIPHMAVLPEALSVNGISPPDLVVRFGCERNEDAPPDEWPNWCLEFMHNQLYEYFHNMGARWMKRPFQIELAKKVRWKTVKHMNRYFSHAERVLDAWREKGPQYLDPQLSYIEGGATPEEVARPHGVYLLRNGVPTNYFAPNFDPPYTTKMTRSLLLNVLDKSWDKKRREWTSEPVPKLLTPTTLVATMCGCADPAQGGFLANEVTADQITQNTTVENAITPVNLVKSHSLASSFHLNPLDTQHLPESPVPSRASPLISETGVSHRLGAPPTPERERPIAEVAENSASEAAASSIATVQHMNSTSAKLVQRELDRKNIMKQETVKEEVTSSNASTVASKSESPTKKKKKSKQDKEVEIAREIAKVALTQNLNGTRPSIVDESMKDPRKVHLAQAVADFEEKKVGDTQYDLHRSSRTSPVEVVKRKDSDISLEYSMDSSMLGEASTLAGQYIGDGSVTTASQRSSRNKANRLPRTAEVSDTSSVAESGVPTDQELFAVGWAKALDPKSGAYYYFTLDRSKIVWDNPLEPQSSVVSGSIIASDSSVENSLHVI